MEQGLFKHWPIWILVAAAGTSLAVSNLIRKPALTLLQPENLSYEMLRPQAMKGNYDLSGRKVIRNLHSPDRARPIGAVPPGAAPVSSTSVKGKAQQDDAKTRARVAQAAAQKKAEADRKVAQQKKREAEKKARLSIRMNNEGRGNSVKGFEPTSNSAAAPAGYAGAAPVAAAQTVSPEALRDDKTKLSPGQWRSLLQGQPTEQNATAFLQAYAAGEVDRSTFFQVARELLTDSAEDRQSVGLFLLKQQPSVDSFTILVANYKSESQTKIYDVLKTYSQASKLSILKQVMATADLTSVSLATQLLAKVVDSQVSASAANTALSGRETRNPSATAQQVSNSQLLAFLPVLEHLASQSKNEDLANQALSLKNKIQGLKSA